MNGPLRIVCDENLCITPALEAIACSITRLPGRGITQSDLTTADVLLVRSVTKVDKSLLINSPVRFVGTATAGTEHIDIAALASMGVSFAAAPGVNANAVVEYVLTALAFSGRLEAVVAGGCVGVVGLGYVGRLLCRRIQALGGRVVAFDPLVTKWPSGITRTSLVEVLSQPVVSLHAALHDSIPHGSHHLISAANLSSFSAGQLLINAGRGGLITRDALVALHKKGITLVLDTWPNEPCIDAELLSMTLLATPHIAGYSFEAKALATDSLVGAIIDNKLVDSSSLQQDVNRSSALEAREVVNARDLSGFLLATYAIDEDDRRLRAAAAVSADCAGVAASSFDALRRDYPLRHELRGSKLSADDLPSNVSIWADALDFTLTKEIRNE